ncbi:MAG TPA: alginate O-acetyltransferase [Gammaproteobacteria bacterium]|nr:alginate O-acetyltransferase [Gammaproteobacteria bacterium]
MKYRYLRYFSMIFLIAFIVGIGAWSLPALEGFRPRGMRGLFNGEWALALEKHYNQRLPIRDMGIHLWTAVQYGLLNEGRQGVVVGRDGWLFTDEEFRTHDDAAERIGHRFKEIESIHAYLRAHNVALVLALVPAKARIYPGQLGGRKPAAFYQSLYGDALRYAAGRQLIAPDLCKAMRRALVDRPEGTQLFLKTDTHWTPEGAAVAAAAIAEEIAKQGVLPPEGAVRFRTEMVSTRVYQGDLLNYLPLGPFSDWFGPAADELKVYVTRRAEESITSEGLFSDNGADVVLVGSSYSANSLWNFTGALEQALSREVVNYATEGKGPVLPMLEYLVSDDFSAKPPRLVIWEFPERYLPVVYPYPNGKYTELLAGAIDKISTDTDTAVHGGTR